LLDSLLQEDDEFTFVHNLLDFFLPSDADWKSSCFCQS